MEYLPEAIIHRIQSLLTGKEAARTTLLSKSWRSAWLTRPDLDFEQGHSKKSKFQNVVSKCIRRYVQSNLNIQSFGLSMKAYSSDPAAKQFIVKALEMGATRLNLRGIFVLPVEVFASENLVELSVEEGSIDLFRSSVRCSRLRSLTIARVSVKINVVAHILSHCPLIEKLSLSDICKQKYFYRPDQIDDLVVGDQYLPKMHNLKSLMLCSRRFQKLFLGELSSSKFPALKDLTIEYMAGYNNLVDFIRISNNSLEQLNFDAKHHSLEIELDVPSIRKFTYNGTATMSSLSFKSTSREWESHVSIKSSDYIGISWLCGLNKLLTGLSMSTIYLSLDVRCITVFDYDLEGIQGSPKPQVENLIMASIVPPVSCYALFDGLFRICSPNSITQYLVPESSDGSWETNNHFLCTALVHKTTRGKRKRTMQSFDLRGLDDLKEVSLYILDEVDGEWREIVPLETLLDAPSPTNKQKIQFRMTWK